MTDLGAAWSVIHDAMPDGWYVGPPTYVEHRPAREHYASDTRERHMAGRSHEWTAVGASELELVREMARCMRLIREGRVPG